MTSLAPSIGTSSTGRQSAVMPSLARSKACSRDRSQVARTPTSGIGAIERAQSGARRIVRRDRRPQPLHAAALLVDEHRRAGSADAVAHRGDQIAHLVWLADIAGEQDEAPWPLVLVEGDLVGAQDLPEQPRIMAFDSVMQRRIVGNRSVRTGTRPWVRNRNGAAFGGAVEGLGIAGRLLGNEATAAGGLEIAAEADRIVARSSRNTHAPHGALAVNLGLDDIAATVADDAGVLARNRLERLVRAVFGRLRRHLHRP